MNSSSIVLDRSVAAALVGIALFYSVATVLVYRHVVASDPKFEAATNRRAALQALGSDDPIKVLRFTFPLHVTEETMEVIEHPGAPYIRKEVFPSDLNAHKLRVPMFFDQAYGPVYGRARIRDYLGDGGQRLMTPEEAASIGSFDSQGHETIYASVASYRDPECAGTVADLYDRAEYPERIRVAIVEQRLQGDTICTTPTQDCAIDPSQALCRFQHLIDYYEMDAHFGVGPVFARHLAHRHYRGGMCDMRSNEDNIV
jgi:hypothetical protein